MSGRIFLNLSSGCLVSYSGWTTWRLDEMILNRSRDMTFCTSPTPTSTSPDQYKSISGRRWYPIESWMPIKLSNSHPSIKLFGYFWSYTRALHRSNYLWQLWSTGWTQFLPRASPERSRADIYSDRKWPSWPRKGPPYIPTNISPGRREFNLLLFYQAFSVRTPVSNSGRFFSVFRAFSILRSNCAFRVYCKLLVLWATLLGSLKVRRFPGGNNVSRLIWVLNSAKTSGSSKSSDSSDYWLAQSCSYSASPYSLSEEGGRFVREW